MDRGKLIALQNGGMKCVSALPGGRAVFAVPECVRAGVGMTGQRNAPSLVNSGSSFRSSRLWHAGATGWGSGCTKAKGHWVQDLA